MDIEEFFNKYTMKFCLFNFSCHTSSQGLNHNDYKRKQKNFSVSLTWGGVEYSYLIPIWKISCDPSFWYQLNSEKWRSPQIFKTIQPLPPSFLPTYIYMVRCFCSITIFDRNSGACLKVGGGGQDNTGAIPRKQAGLYPVFFYYPPKKWEGTWPPRLFRVPWWLLVIIMISRLGPFPLGKIFCWKEIL